MQSGEISFYHAWKLFKDVAAKYNSSVMKMYKKYRSVKGDFGADYKTKSEQSGVSFTMKDLGVITISHLNCRHYAEIQRADKTE